MSHVYAVGDMSYRRHITNDGSETLCGMPAGQREPLALPVTCDACRTANGRLTRERMAAEAARVGKCSTMGCTAPATHLLTWQDAEGAPVQESVCEGCGVMYTCRPALRATLQPLEA